MGCIRKDPVVQNASPQLNDRYGTQRNRKRDVWIGGTFAGVLVLGGIVFLATGGMPTQNSTIEFNDIAHTIDDSGTETTLTFEVNVAPERTAVCQLEALNTSYAVVGSLLVELPPSDQRTRVFTEEIRTHSLATSVTVNNCWVQPQE